MSHATARYYWIDKTDQRYLYTFPPEDLLRTWHDFRLEEQDERLPTLPEEDESVVNPKFARFCAERALFWYATGLDVARADLIGVQFKPRGKGVTRSTRALEHETLVLIWPGIRSDPPNTYQFMGYTTDLAFKVLAQEREGQRGNYYEMDEGQLLHMRGLR